MKIFQEALESCHQTDFEASVVKKEEIKHIKSEVDDFIGGYSNKAQEHIPCIYQRCHYLLGV